MYSVALDDSARPSRPLSNATTVCHALLLDRRTCVCFEILRGGRRARVFSGAARAAAGAGSWFAILLASFVVAPTSGSRPPSPSPRLEAVVLQLKLIGEAQAIAGCTEQQVT